MYTWDSSQFPKNSIKKKSGMLAATNKWDFLQSLFKSERERESNFNMLPCPPWLNRNFRESNLAELQKCEVQVQLMKGQRL